MHVHFKSTLALSPNSPDGRCLAHLSAVCPNYQQLERIEFGQELYLKRIWIEPQAPVVEPRRRRYTPARFAIVCFSAACSLLQCVSSDRLQEKFKRNNIIARRFFTACWIKTVSNTGNLHYYFKIKTFIIHPAAPSVQIHIFYLLPSGSKLPRGHF